MPDQTPGNRVAEAAAKLSDRIIDLVAADHRTTPIGETVLILGSASLSALLSLVAVGGGTRESAQLTVDTLMAPLLDDIFGPAAPDQAG